MKRHNNRIVESSICEKEFSNFSLSIIDDKFPHFNIYKVVMPQKIKGMNPIWHYMIIKDSLLKFKRNSRISILKENVATVYNLIRNKTTNNEGLQIEIKTIFNPILLISDFEDFRLKDERLFNDELIFFLDRNDLPNRKSYRKKIISLPIIQEVRRKFHDWNVHDRSKSKNNLIKLFTPFAANSPAIDWKFFGRRNEIDKIMSSTKNFFIVGGRRIGKTSLLQEVGRRFEQIGHKVYFIPVQHCKSESEVILQISSSLSKKDHMQVMRRNKFFDKNYFQSLVKQLIKTNQKSKVVIILDELGNVYSNINDQNDSWEFLGVLREYSHSNNNNLMVILSGFQELIQKQINQNEGPFVNFGETLKLRPLDKEEVKDFIIGALKPWSQIENQDEIVDFIIKHCGTMPVVLQVLGEYLFEHLFSGRNLPSLQALCKKAISNIEIFDQIVDDVFMKMKSSLHKYVFLKFCDDVYFRKETFTEHRQEITINDINNILESLELKLTFPEREGILEGLALHGLTIPDPTNNLSHILSAPIFYLNLKNRYNIKTLLNQFIYDII